MFRLAGCALAALFVSIIGAGALAQDIQAPPPQNSRQRDLPLESSLQDAAQLFKALSVEDVRRTVGEHFMTITDDGRVHVEIVAPEGLAAVPRDFVQPFGGSADTRWRNRVDAWVPLGTLVDLARALPPGHRIERASAGEPDEVAGEGPAAIGSDGYRDAGANGNGLVIAIIDGDYRNLTAARANGDAPTLENTTVINLTPDLLEDISKHGTGCVEAAFDHCPGATWRLYKIDSQADLGAAVADAITNGVDVISHSRSYHNTGWADDTGAPCAAAQQAANAGILFLTSAGNYAQQHWQGVFSDDDADDVHNFVSTDETIDIVMPDNAQSTFHLAWDTDAGAADYDLYLYNDTMTTLLDSSTNGGSAFESIWWMNYGDTAVNVNLVIRKVSGANVELELFGHGGSDPWEHALARGSTTSPSNTTHPNVISVGAVDWGDFPLPGGSAGILMDYSSQGPSNSGMTLPDLVGPTNTQGLSYPAVDGGFEGTSCSTPNAAGALCAHWSSVNAFSESAVRWLFLEQSQLHRDWGVGGADQLFGRGGASLAPYAAARVWLARGFGNTGNLTTGPYYTFGAAYQAVTTGGCILALPGNYPELIPLLTKTHRIEGYEGVAVLGR